MINLSFFPSKVLTGICGSVGKQSLQKEYSYPPRIFLILSGLQDSDTEKYRSLKLAAQVVFHSLKSVKN